MFLGVRILNHYKVHLFAYILGYLKHINFQFGSKGKLTVFGVQILKGIKVYVTCEPPFARCGSFSVIAVIFLFSLLCNEKSMSLFFQEVQEVNRQ